MKTVEQIMEIVSDYASEIADIASSEAVFAHIGKSRYADRDKTLAELRTAIEELAADAEKHGELAESAANFMRGMTFDSRLPEDIRFAVLSKIAAIDAAMEST